jgi:hypothetical protein
MSQAGVAKGGRGAGGPAAAPARRPQGVWPLVKRALRPVASLRLTVALFVLSFALVFLGTLAQTEYGIWTVVGRYFWSWYVWVPLQSLAKFAQTFFDLSPDARWPGFFPFPGGKLLGLALFVNLLVAHLVRFRLSWRRAGVLVLHAGLLLLFVSEFITRTYAVEGSMTIPNGGSSNMLIHIHQCELAVIDTSRPDADEVTVVPGSRLHAGQTVSDPQLPFDIHVDELMTNSALVGPFARPDAPKATAGYGLSVAAQPAPEVQGTDAGSQYDHPSAYVTLTNKETGTPIGTYLVSTRFDDQERPNQPVALGGKTYEIALRFKRTYKPYTIHLKEFKHEVYPGTDKPKNFESDVLLEDPELGVKRELSISMNDPLRHRGEAFYQSSFLPGDRGTVLQVVRNPGWVLPYLSCFIVSVGMLTHFGIMLVGYLRRRASA